MKNGSLATGLMLLLCGLAPAQQKIPYDGTEVFRFALHKHGLKPESNTQAIPQSIRESVIVLFGDTSNLPNGMTGTVLRSFISHGGAVLIVTDRPINPALPGTWANEFDITIGSGSVESPDGRGYRELNERPYIRPRVDLFQDLRNAVSPYDLIRGVPEDGAKAIATDRPSTMKLPPRDRGGLVMSNLAGYMRGARLDGRPLPPGDDNFAVSYRDPASGGRLVVLADQSVFVNGMLGFVNDENAKNGFTFDNGNWAFTNRTIEWLQSGFEEPRTRCLFIENGQIKDKFAIEISKGPKPPIPDLPPEVMANLLLNYANPVLNELQEKDVFNKFIEQNFGYERILKGFLIVVTVLLAFAAIRRFLGTYRKPDGQTLAPGEQAAMLPKGGVVRQRTNAQVEVGNLYEAASRRIRDRFDRLGGRPGPANEMPPILIANDSRDAGLIRSSIEWLWQIGYGSTPVTVSAHEWDQVNGLLERVTRRAAKGDWSFGAEV